MKRYVVSVLLLVVVLSGCSAAKTSAGSDKAVKPLSQAEIQAIIRETNKSLIGNVLSPDDKPSPAEQARANEMMQKLGKALKDKATVDNRSVILARVDGEALTAFDWYYRKGWEMGKAENSARPVSSDREILDELIEIKAITSAARQLGLYPPVAQIEAYVADQRRIMNAVKPEEIFVMLDAWGISEEEYYELMKGVWTDSLARTNWCFYMKKHVLPHAPKESSVTDVNELYNNQAARLREKAKVEITPAGRALGLR